MRDLGPGWGCLGPTPEGLKPGSVLVWPMEALKDIGRQWARLYRSDGIEREFTSEFTPSVSYDEDGAALITLSAETQFAERISVTFPYAACEWRLSN